MLNCLNYLKGQEGQLPNIRTILATILTVPRHLRAQPTWYTSTVSEFSCVVRYSKLAWPRGQLLRRKAVLVLCRLTVMSSMLCITSNGTSNDQLQSQADLLATCGDDCALEDGVTTTQGQDAI
jgi:hypothetical protein